MASILSIRYLILEDELWWLMFLEELMVVWWTCVMTKITMTIDILATQIDQHENINRDLLSFVFLRYN